MSNLRILIADDHAGIRRSIRTLVEAHPQWTVCGEASGGREAVEQVKRLRPDVALVDLSMPDLNGLEAAQQIRRDAPETRVLIMTVHETQELAYEVRRAGAQGVITKSEAHDALRAEIESLSFVQQAVHLAGSAIDHARHIAAFFRSPADRYRVLAPFVAEGLQRGEKAVHLINATERDLHVQRLRDAGADVADAEAHGQIEFQCWTNSYLQDGSFAALRMTRMLREKLDEGRAYGATRLIGFMEWALADPPGVEQLVEYENRLNSAMPDSGDVVVCAYDVTKFSGDVIVDLLRCHTGVVIGDRFAVNPFYVPPERAGYF